MSSTPDSLGGAYCAESCGWDNDRRAAESRERRLAWRVAIGGWVVAIGTSLALAMLGPLRHVEPFVVRVDNATGIVDVVPAFTPGTGIDDAVTRYFVGHYVTVCERFNRSIAESDYEECSAFNGPRRNQAWYALWQTGNASSPLNVHRDGSEVRAQVQSISFFRQGGGGTNIAQVRYLKWLQSGPDASAVATHWIATIHYSYAAPSGNVRLRAWNPLGFRVDDFLTEPEVSDVASGEGRGGAP